MSFAVLRRLVTRGITFAAFCFPLSSWADGFTLTPPNTDLSLQYLSMMFGVVSGVLHGSGTQIFGQMFNVFNSAVLALGGIVVSYTFIVSTLNTAGSGEVMGREWSSIWIPIKSAGGIALMLPKGTGYSTIQVFMMWVIVQGIGAADRIWESVLNYLSQGGVIIQQNATGLTPSTQPPSTMSNIGTLFLNTVCLQGMTSSLGEEYRQNPNAKAPPPDLFALISTQISQAESFYSSGSNFQTSKIIVGLPWQSSSTYLASGLTPKGYTLGSQCGRVEVSVPGAAPGQNPSSIIPLMQARLMALQQMINDLQPAAALVQSTYNNYLTETEGTPTNVTIPYPDLGFSNCAASPNLHIGTTSQLGGCPNANSVYVGGILSPTLFQDAYADYQGLVYAPSQTLGSAALASQGNLSAALIQKAKAEGWLMAGRYFIDLSNANNTNACGR